MAISGITKPRCPYCGKVVEVTSQVKVANKTIYKLACGHTIFSAEQLKSVEESFFDSFSSFDGMHMLPFQKQGALFTINANARALIADDTGLGKTVQGISVVKQMNLRRGIIICKAGLRDQWEHEWYRWGPEIGGLVRVIREPGIDKIYLKHFPVTIVSFESLYRCKWIADDDLLEQMDFVIIDEVQKIKNLEAKMTQAVRRICHNPSMQRSIPHVIGLSATPIKNNAAEYFPILNILYPEIFNNFNNFTWKYVDSYYQGQYRKYGGIDHEMLDDFKTTTSKFIIRRTREEVMPELPLISRNTLFTDISEKVKEDYDKLVEKFQDEYMTGKRDFAPGSNLLQIMNMMRYVIGMAKVDGTFDFIEEFLETTTRQLVIFVHHHDVANLLYLKLKKMMDKPPLSLVGETPDARTPIVEQFKNGESRILLATTLASGEGLNLQFCSDAIILEFEWNPANEYQAETRFPRIGFTVTAENQNRVTITRPIAVGTMDEFMIELKARKQTYMDSALKGEVTEMSHDSVYKEMAEKIMSINVEKFNIKKV